MSTKHGLRHTSEYTSWALMKGRCLNPNNAKYPRYGGRGITVCRRWVNDFAAFYADMGPKPSPQHTLDRINNNRGYSPANCRWALPTTQSNNRHTTRLFAYKGAQDTLRGFAKRYEISYKLLKNRLELGWTLAKAIATPLGADEKRVTFRGRTQSLSAWGREVGISGGRISERLREGWSVERALTQPLRVWPKKA
jgi:hypothetical protein